MSNTSGINLSDVLKGIFKDDDPIEKRIKKSISTGNTYPVKVKSSERGLLLRYIRKTGEDFSDEELDILTELACITHCYKMLESILAFRGVSSSETYRRLSKFRRFLKEKSEKEDKRIAEFFKKYILEEKRIEI